jgi:hypothetical protein
MLSLNTEWKLKQRMKMMIMMKKFSYHVIQRVLLFINMAQVTHQFMCLNYSLQKHDSSNVFRHRIFAGFAVRHT